MRRLQRKPTKLFEPPPQLDFEAKSRMADEQFENAAKLFRDYGRIQSEEHILQILDTISQVGFFINSCPEDLPLSEFTRTCLESLSYEFIPKETAIFHMGDKGDKFYIILKGSVSICVPVQQAKIDEETTHRRIQYNEKRRRKSALTQETLDDFNVPTDEKLFMQMLQCCNKPVGLVQSEIMLYRTQQKPNQYFTNAGVAKIFEVAKLIAGQFFGEVALTTDKPRGATIIARTDLDLIVMNKVGYKRVFEKQIEKFQAKLNLMMNMLSGQQIETQKFLQYFSEVNYIQNQVIWNLGDPVSSFMLLKSGVVELSIPDKLWVLSEVDGPAFIGEEQVLKRDTIRVYKCRALTSCQALVINARDFNMIKRHYDVLVNNLKIISRQREEWLIARLNHLDFQSKLQKETRFDALKKPSIGQHLSRLLPRDIDELTGRIRNTKSLLFRSTDKPHLSESQLVKAKSSLLKDTFKADSQQLSLSDLSSLQTKRLQAIQLEQALAKKNLVSVTRQEVPRQSQYPRLPSFFQRKRSKWIRQDFADSILQPSASLNVMMASTSKQSQKVQTEPVDELQRVNSLKMCNSYYLPAHKLQGVTRRDYQQITTKNLSREWSELLIQ